MWRNSTLAFLLQEKTTNINSKRALYLDNHLAQRLSKKETHWMHIDEAEGRDLGDFFFPLSTFTRCIWRLHWDVSRFERESGKGIAERDMMKRTIYLFSFCWPNIFYLCDTHFFLVSLNTFPEKSPHREAICHHFLYLGHGTWFQASATEDPGAVSVHVTW